KWVRHGPNLASFFFSLFLDVFFARICFYLSHHHAHCDLTFFFEEKGAGTLMPLPSRWPQTFNFLSIPARSLPDILALRLSMIHS
ncbi:hypothetical protein EDB84DRAFT_1521044, partial [Lactarius hengduanensis]